MAKKSMIERDKKKIKMVEKYKYHRQSIEMQISKAVTLDEKYRLYTKLQSLPRNSSPVRITNRCFVTGRPRAVYRDFKLSRHVLREMAHEGLLPGVIKASW
jgi:small subunit ribosomal protein S14